MDERYRIVDRRDDRRPSEPGDKIVGRVIDVDFALDRASERQCNAQRGSCCREVCQGYRETDCRMPRPREKRADAPRCTHASNHDAFGAERTLELARINADTVRMSGKLMRLQNVGR